MKLWHSFGKKAAQRKFNVIDVAVIFNFSVSGVSANFGIGFNRLLVLYRR